MAPEVMEQKPTGYDTKADIWSLGITAIELATGTAPYHKYPPMKVLMMTLQNEPPTLDLCAEEKDQYKSYSKTFRKMIAECLKKDPSERPTARQLLKHDFFKKAKDKAYIAKHLALPADARNMKVKTKLPVPSIATSGRWNKRADGEWGFDFDDQSKTVDNESAAAASGRLSPDSDDDDNDDDTNNENKTLHSDNVNMNLKNSTNLITANTNTNANSNNKNQTPTTNLNASNSSSSNVSSSSSSLSTNTNSTQSGNMTNNSSSKQQPPPPINLVLRMRDEKKELQDIKFEFLPNKDTVDEISHELVNAKLIDAIDMIVVSANLSKLLENNLLSPITFQLVKTI